MRRILFTALGALALVIGLGAPALASNGPNPNSNSSDNHHFTAQYVEGTFSAGPVTWTCNGESIDNNGHTARTEQETCNLSGPGTAGILPGTYGNPAGIFGTFPGYPASFNGFSWFSDFNGQYPALTWVITVNGASNRAHITATYAD
jgi:hypothetical protein